MVLWKGMGWKLVRMVSRDTTTYVRNFVYFRLGHFAFVP